MSAAAYPRAGTVLRAVYDAMHARWCGPDCSPSCTEWRPDTDEMKAAIAAVRAFDAAQNDAKFAAALAAEVGPAPATDRTIDGHPVEWRLPTRRSRAAHAFVHGPGQGDASLCGLVLTGSEGDVFALTPLCRVCLSRVTKADDDA